MIGGSHYGQRTVFAFTGGFFSALIRDNANTGDVSQDV